MLGSVANAKNANTKKKEKEGRDMRIMAFDGPGLVKNTGLLSDMIDLWKQLDQVDAEHDGIDGLKMTAVTDDYFRERLLADAGFLAFADDDSLIGMVSNTDSTDHTNATYCCRLVVDVAHRHQGVGTALMRAILDENAARGFKTILGCSIHNQAAISLYTKLGFAVTAQTLVHDGWRSTVKKAVHA